MVWCGVWYSIVHLKPRDLVSQWALTKGKKQIVKRIRRVIVAGCILSVSMVTPIIGSGDAQAFCNGKGAPYSAWVGDPVHGKEDVHNSSTCDGLGDYNGRYIDTEKDGTDIYIKYYKDGEWLVTKPNASLKSWMKYSYTDSNGYSPSYICDTHYKCGGEFVNTGF